MVTAETGSTKENSMNRNNGHNEYIERENKKNEAMCIHDCSHKYKHVRVVSLYATAETPRRRPMKCLKINE
jgi:hypothetical protein